ncbi:hypothetical protein [Pseudoflavonifractor sp. MCC625]|uniref:hypothetical protein n=1 Tax=Pseudoflavonifractor sp. MCC625 TaxID=2592647 RepID=UPI001C00F127|nr:hypothetical protein [Pseudoflavonifractor sp. MCC625]
MEWEAAFIRRWILERARVGAWIWMGLGLLGLAAAEMLYDGWQLPLLLFWVWVIGYMDVISILTIKELRHQMARLDQTCDPAPLLAWCRSVLRQNPGSTRYRVYEGFCLLLLGREVEALSTLEQVEGRRKLWRQPDSFLLYVACRSDLSDPGTAGQWLEQGRRAARRKWLGRKTLEKALKEQELCLALRQGQTEGLEGAMKACLEKASSLRLRVAWHYELGQLFRALGRPEEAAEHLRFVAQYGNRLAIRSRAEELLEPGR